MVLVTLFVAILRASNVAHAQESASHVGFRQIEFADAVTGQRVSLFVWYPTSQASRPTRFGPYTLDVARNAPPAGGRHRLAMISHGTGGDPLSHAQLAMALGRRGYVAAAPRHAMAPPGILLDPISLAKVGVPVRLYAAELDAVVPGRYHAEPLRQTLKPAPEFVLVRGAGHYAFVEPFPDAVKQQAGEGATDPPGFDRAIFQEKLRHEIAEFLDRVLR